MRVIIAGALLAFVGAGLGHRVKATGRDGFIVPTTASLTQVRKEAPRHVRRVSKATLPMLSAGFTPAAAFSVPAVVGRSRSLQHALVPRTVVTALATPTAEVVKGPRTQVLGPWFSRKRVLNVEKVHAPSPAVDKEGATELAQQLRDQIRQLFVDSMYIDDGGARVNYAGLRNSPDFAAYTALAQCLAGVDARSMAPDERKAFFLNLYNALLIHAIAVADKPPPNLLARLKLYATATYDIGGDLLSLNDIEHGVLRDNRPAAAPLARPQFNADTSIALSLPVDARIHFALNCGAESCPPIRFYEASALNEDLDLATESFLEDVSVGGREVELSQLFDFYRADFVDTAPPPADADIGGGAANGDDAAIVRWVAKHAGPGELREKLEALLRSNGGITLKYAPYDWSLNQM